MILSQNLLYFRHRCNLSRQQAAEALQVQTDILSSWEAGHLQPGTQQLPQIAETYGVTIDDLFSRRPSSFDNSAQRLAAVFDSTHTAEDFALADEAFRTLQNQGCLSCEDLRCYAQLQQTMMNHCMEQALSLFEEGTALIRGCSKLLDDAELKVVRLMKGADGEPVEMPFTEEV
jgi:exonuclease VII small subunit/DNA-binding XRE family transcriptional regulator